MAGVLLGLITPTSAWIGVGFAGLGDPVAVAAGLVLGKPVGILLFSWAAVRCGVTKLPDGVTWGMMAGAACLAGIGFTMSLFLTGLSFPPVGDGSGPDLAAAGKIGTLIGSLVAGVVGGLWLLAATRAARPARASDGRILDKLADNKGHTPICG